MELAGTFEFRDPRRGKGKERHHALAKVRHSYPQTLSTCIYGQQRQNLLFYYIQHVDLIVLYNLVQIDSPLLMLHVDRMTLPEPMLCLVGRFSLAKGQAAQATLSLRQAPMRFISKNLTEPEIEAKVYFVLQYFNIKFLAPALTLASPFGSFYPQPCGSFDIIILYPQLQVSNTLLTK